MKVSQIRQLIQEEIKKLLNEAVAPTKKIGDIIRTTSGIKWRPGESKIYVNTRVTKTQKVIDYKIVGIDISKQSVSMVRNSIGAALKKYKYPPVTGEIFVEPDSKHAKAVILFQIRYDIHPIEMK